jgi:hypothetical protein
MARITHVTMAGTAAQSLEALIAGKPGERQTIVRDSLDQGPLRDLHTPAGLAARAAWLGKMYEAANCEGWAEHFEGHLGLADLAQAPEPDEIAMIWTGANAMEQTILRAVCHAWPQAQLLTCDVAPLGVGFEGRSAVAVCSQDQLEQALAQARPLSEFEREALAAEWRALTSDGHMLRLYQDGALNGYDESYFDEALLAQCEPTFKRTVFVVGHVMGYAADYIADTFLFYRMRTLIARGLVEAENGAAGIRELRVRRG